ncbi:uncharacterized protein LOC144309401 [Canis aureus]
MCLTPHQIHQSPPCHALPDAPPPLEGIKTPRGERDPLSGRQRARTDGRTDGRTGFPRLPRPGRTGVRAVRGRVLPGPSAVPGPRGEIRGALTASPPGSVPLSFAPVVGCHLAAAFIERVPSGGSAATGKEQLWCRFPGAEFQEEGGSGASVRLSPGPRRAMRSPEIGPPELRGSVAVAAVAAVASASLPEEAVRAAWVGRPAPAGGSSSARADRPGPPRGRGTGCVPPSVLWLRAIFGPSFRVTRLSPVVTPWRRGPV